MKFTTSVVAFSSAILVSAGGYPATTTVTVTADPGPTSYPPSCNVGSIQCCNSVYQAYDPTVGRLLELLGVAVDDLNVLVGLNCSPISIIGIGGNSCSAQPVCCQYNDWHGLVNIGCTPINLSL